MDLDNIYVKIGGKTDWTKPLLWTSDFVNMWEVHIVGEQVFNDSSKLCDYVVLLTDPKTNKKYIRYSLEDGRIITGTETGKRVIFNYCSAEEIEENRCLGINIEHPEEIKELGEF